VADRGDSPPSSGGNGPHIAICSMILIAICSMIFITICSMIFIVMRTVPALPRSAR